MRPDEFRIVSVVDDGTCTRLFDDGNATIPPDTVDCILFVSVERLCRHLKKQNNKSQKNNKKWMLCYLQTDTEMLKRIP